MTIDAPVAVHSDGPTTTPRSAARWAGTGYVVIFVLAILANFAGLGRVLDPADASATASSLAASGAWVRVAAVAFLVIAGVDVMVSWALWVLFRGVHRDLSPLAAWFRLAYSVILDGAIVFLFLALALVDAPVAGPSHDTAILLALQAFDFMWVAGLAAFGVHLVLVGRLLLLGQAPRLLAWVLAVAGVAYIGDAVAHIALADYEAWSTGFLVMVAVPSMLGELAFTVWLLRRGLRRRGSGRIGL